MKKYLFFPLIIFLHLFYLQPSAQNQVIVAGAGNSLVNGTYTYASDSNGRPYYTKGKYRIEYRNAGWGIEWELYDTTPPIISSNVQYSRASTAATPVVSGWGTESGISPPPTIKSIISYTGGSSYTPPLPVPGTNNNLIGRFYLSASESGALLASVTLALSGTYSGLTYMKIWSSADNAFDAGTDACLGSVLYATTPVTISASSSPIPTSGAYYFITADLAAGASGAMHAQFISQASVNLGLGTITAFFADPQISSGNSPLPVELISFNAAAKDSKVLLSWQTASEVNNYGFEVQRAQGQDLKDAVWEKIGFVEGHGSSSSIKEYSFTDDNPLPGQSSYRIKQIDNSGGFKYYDALAVRVDAPKEFKLLQNSPNPFNPVTVIKFSLPASSYVTIKVYDIRGREVAALLSEEKPAGVHLVYWNGKDNSGQTVSSGIYLYRLQSGAYAQTRKMSLLK